MEHLDPFTPEYPRESFRGRLINYAPSIFIGFLMVFVPLPWAYMWSKLASQWVGLWGYAVFLGSTLLTLGYLLHIHLTRPSHLPPVPPVDRVTKLCRAACILFNVLIFTAWGDSIIILLAILFDPEGHRESLLTIIALGILAIGTGYVFIYSTYLRCQWSYYEQVIMEQNAERYGEPVVVSIPVFKLCGHFVLYTTTHKYELRLDRTSNFRPYFLHRPLTPTETSQNSDSLNSSPRYHLFISGWTQCTHTDIVRTFNEAISHFGSYNRLTNNCRTFLQSGCGSIVQTTSAWYEDMLMVEPGHVFLLGQMAIMMYRAMLRELCRWVWCVKWGPDWESTVQYRGKFIDLADAETSQRLAHIFD